VRRPLSPERDGALAVTTADLDRDGTLDVAVASESAGSLAWLPNHRVLFWDDFESFSLSPWAATGP
jgi:hypothetical protein